MRYLFHFETSTIEPPVSGMIGIRDIEDTAQEDIAGAAVFALEILAQQFPNVDSFDLTFMGVETDA